MMPVSTIDVLDENNFISVLEAKRLIESLYGCLIPEAEFRTNGPAVHYQIPGRKQRIGFHRGDDKPAFLRKLQQTSPHMRREIASMSRQLPGVRHHETAAAGASDAELRQFFLDVVERKPAQHDFRAIIQPNRKMVAIGRLKDVSVERSETSLIRLPQQ